MAFNATTILNRYNVAGFVSVLKSDFTKLAADLITLETFAATASTNAGKWSKLLLAEVVVTPATNIQLKHINTGGYASSVDNGKWTRLLLSSDSAVTPATNIGLQHLNTNGFGSSSIAGAWRSIFLSSDVAVTPATNIQLFHINTNGYASTTENGKWEKLLLDKSISPGTNIGISDLKATTSVTTISTSQVFPVNWNTLGPNPTSAPGQSATAVPFYLVSSTLLTDTGAAKFWWTSVKADSNTLASGITLGCSCDVAAVQFSGSHVLSAVFTFFGSTGSDTITYFPSAKIYQIDEV